MRIEILAGGLGSVSNLNSGLNSLRSSITSTIDDLRRAKGKLDNLTGGVRNLQSAYNSIQQRVSFENGRLTSLNTLTDQTSAFITNTITTDVRVARIVNSSQERFFAMHEWLRPPVKEEKSFWESFAEGWNNFWGGVGETLKSAFEGIVNFVKDLVSLIAVGVSAVINAVAAIAAICGSALKTVLDGILCFLKEHWVELTIGAVAIIIGAVLTFLTGGAFFAALGAAALSAAISALISGVISGAIAAFTGDNILEAFGDGLASGFMWGGIFSGVHMIATSGVRLAIAKSPQFASKLLSNGKISEFVLKNIIPPGAKNTFGATERIAEGYKYDLQMSNIWGRTKHIQIKWHSADAKWVGNALANSGKGWTAQIKVGNKYLTTLGNLTKNNRQNITHIPIIFFKWWHL